MPCKHMGLREGCTWHEPARGEAGRDRELTSPGHRYGKAQKSLLGTAGRDDQTGYELR